MRIGLPFPTLLAVVLHRARGRLPHSTPGRPAGGLRSSFDEDTVDEDPQNPERAAQERQTMANNRAAIETLRGLGVTLAPFDLPDVPGGALVFIVGAEAAAGFDVATVNGELDSMREAPEQSRWPARFVAARFASAIDYLQANRLRMQIIEQVQTRRSAIWTCSSAAASG